MKRILNALMPAAFYFFTMPSAAALTISSDVTWSGSITLSQDVNVVNGSTLTISAGSLIMLAEGVSIKGERHCHILIQGTSTNKVIIKSSTPGNYWGQLIVSGDSASIEIAFAEIMAGQTYAMDSTTLLIEDSYLHDYLRLPSKNLVYTHNARYMHINRCHLSNYYQINPANTTVLIENSLFEYIHEDGIDCDNSPGAIIRNCTFKNGLCEKGKIHSVDAIDFGKYNMEGLGSIGDVQNCFMYNITDKGVSGGEGCRHVTVTGSLFYKCGSGATIKDSSLAEFINNTVVNCEYGVECVEKNEGLGGGHTTGYNNILWNNGTTAYLDHDGTLSMTYSDISFNGIFPGAGNINSFPMFTDTNALDFQLLNGSPCKGTGSNGNDMGAIFPVGGIADPLDYLNIGIPHSSETINGDSVYMISWISGSNISAVNLDFSSDNGSTWTSIAQNVNASTGSYQWVVPNVYSSFCFVRISDAANALIYSQQYVPFTIIPQGIKSSDPAFSYQAGYYSNDLNLEITAEPGSKIYYTLDGSEPTDKSAEYVQPILLTQEYIDSGYVEQNITLTHPPQFPLSAIRTAPFSQIGPNPAVWRLPVGDISCIKVVKARSYMPGRGLGEVITNSYLIDTDGKLNPGGLPVISLSTDKENFFDYYSGIYIPGASFTGYSFTGNYEVSGKISERPVHFEYFEPQSSRGLSMNVGVRARGEWIRSLGQKALSVFARSEYDSINYFNQGFFPGYTKTPGGEAMNKFKRLILRNDGNNWGWSQTTMMHDGMVQSLFDHMHVKYQAYRQSIVFLDGEYWGLHDIRELPDARNLALTYNMDPEDIAIIEHNLDGHDQLTTGAASDLTDFLALRDFTSQQDLNDPNNYEYVKARIDVDNFIDFWAGNFYTLRFNVDHNCGFWKHTGSTLNPSAPIGRDGKWRLMAYDFDYSFTIPSFSIMTYLQWMDTSNNYFFYKLLKSDAFRSQFISRYADLMNSSFKTSRVVNRINELKSVIEPEIGRHLKRWTTPYSIAEWNAGVDSLVKFAQDRPQYVYDEMLNYFALQGTSLLSVDVNDSSQGKVKVNTIKIDASLPGTEASVYPWQGIYFKQFPITLVAEPENGFRFSHWLETGITNDTLVASLNGDSLFTAVFESDPNWHPATYPQIYINEVAASNHSLVDNYGENPDWLELYNPNDSVIDLAGWFISDASDFRIKHRFGMNDSTKIAAHGFLLLYADNEPEQGALHLSFKIDAGGDDLFLTAPDANTLIDSVSFGLQVSDTSYGRYPDGAPDWIFFSVTTPGLSNIHISVPEISYPSGLIIYPNPLINSIIYFSREISFHLYNEIGDELIYQTKVKEADLSSLSKGIYFIRTDTGESCTLIKVN